MNLTQNKGKLYLDGQPVEKAFKAALKRDGRTMAQLERDCGLSHPTLAAVDYKLGYNITARSLLLAFLEMGYTITIEENT